MPACKGEASLPLVANDMVERDKKHRTETSTYTVPHLLKVQEAAKAFRIGVNTLRSAIQAGELPAYTPNGRTQLLKADQVATWMESKRYHR